MTGSNRRIRGLPFLHRNWTKATNHWFKMGNKSSSEVSEPTAVPHKAPDSEEQQQQQQQQCQRAAKRRRLDNNYDGFPLFEDHGSSTRALRIEVLKISHKNSTRYKNGIMNGLVAPNVKDIAHVKARCKLTIYGPQGGQQVVLHVDSQRCDLKIYKNPASSSLMVRFASLEPFRIPEDKIYVERDDDAVFGLANCYSVFIELESAGDPNWPPLDLVPSMNDEDAFYNRGLPPRQWVMTATIADIFNSRNRKEIPLKVKKQPHQETLTDFRIDVDVRWYTPVSSQLVMRSQEKDVQPSITVFDPNEPIRAAVNGTANGINGTATNGINGAFNPNGADIVMTGMESQPEPPSTVQVDKLSDKLTNGVSPEASEELADGELTPSRSRRARQGVNYNVRQMMNTAMGKEPKKRRRVMDEESGEVDDHTITYRLPPETVQTERFGCLICGAENDRLSQLRAHYMSHPQYEFNFELRSKSTTVTVTSSGGYSTPLRPRIYQLGLPVKPLDLDRYVEGDHSWVSSRLGPDDGRDIQAKFPHVRTQQKLAPRRSKKKVYVPNIKQPLFDPRSKVRLVPGSEIRQLPVDDTWLLRKHRDLLGDFTDVDPPEKEYMQEWDAFILPKHISSPQYLPRAFLSFVKEKAQWLVSKRSRSEEFSKHAALLLARRAISEAEIGEATQRLNEARLVVTSEVVDEPPKKVKSASGCVACGDPVPVPMMLVCSNKACKKRLYHKKCVEDPEKAEEMGRKWVCETCASCPPPQVRAEPSLEA
ncbi:hypothetical protein B0T16DRAFT_77784 [Cercophora newfieldiana]|uniref:Zinc finger PHD-type domain-containing protein n=1 Tax=Cercophora newfieldiana TaxID=92897 RepID=A0AA40CW46_9PEZI|nr:hypothetical protein B0T16DRAFT_77784 [Cercophora newfieldiana]